LNDDHRVQGLPIGKHRAQFTAPLGEARVPRCLDPGGQVIVDVEMLAPAVRQAPEVADFGRTEPDLEAIAAAILAAAEEGR